MRGKKNGARQVLFVLLISLANLATAAEQPVISRALSLEPVAAMSLPFVPHAAGPSEFSQPLSLDHAVQLALQENRVVLSAVLDRGLQQQDLLLAESEFTPKFLLAAQTNRSVSRNTPENNASYYSLSPEVNLKLPFGQLALTHNTSRNTVSDNTSSRAVTTALRLVVPLLKGNASVATLVLQSARLTEAIGRFQYEFLLSETVANVVSAYCDASEAQLQVDFAERALERNREIQSVNATLYRAGRLAQQDLLEFEVDIAQGELNLAQARNTVEQVKRSLLQLFGPIGARAPVAALRLVNAVPSPATPTMTENAALELAYANREDIKIAEHALTIARFVLRRAENDTLPQLDLISGVERAHSASNGIANHPGVNYSMGLILNMHIGDTASKVARNYALANLKKAEWALEDLRLDIRNQVASSIRDVHFAQSQLVLATRALELSQSRLENELAKLKAGRTSTFQLSATQESLRQAQVNWGIAQLAVPRVQLQLHRVTSQVQAQWGTMNQ